MKFLFSALSLVFCGEDIVVTMFLIVSHAIAIAIGLLLFSKISSFKRIDMCIRWSYHEQDFKIQKNLRRSSQRK